MEQNAGLFESRLNKPIRLEQCDQTITLCRLEPVLKKLDISIVDVFGDKR